MIIRCKCNRHIYRISTDYERESVSARLYNNKFFSYFESIQNNPFLTNMIMLYQSHIYIYIYINLENFHRNGPINIIIQK